MPPTTACSSSARCEPAAGCAPFSRPNGPRHGFRLVARVAKPRRRWRRVAPTTMVQHALAGPPPRTRVLSPLGRPHPCMCARRAACAGTPEHEPRPSPQRELPTTHARMRAVGRSRSTPTNRHPQRGWIGTPRRLAPPERLHPLGPVRVRDHPIGCRHPWISPGRLESRIGGV